MGNPLQQQNIHILSKKINNGLISAVYGFSIPYLPDFLLDHTLLGQNSNEKLDEVLGRFERFVVGLRKFQNAAYSLRFISDLQSGAIHTFLLGRILDTPTKANSLAQYAAQDVAAHLTSFGIPYIPLNEHNTAPLSLEWASNPFGTQTPAVIEIRQKEEVVKLSPRGDANANSLAYIIHPYIASEGTLIEPFENILRQPFQTVISIYIQPTEVSSQEFEDIDRAAQIGQTLADLSVAPVSQTGIQRWKDPVADMVGRIYARYSKSLIEPFIGIVQVLSVDGNTAWNAARSFASVIGNIRKNEKNEHDLPAQPQIIIPRTSADNTAALYTFQQMIWTPWGESKATQGKERFPYLMGARAASSIFRFPIRVLC